jgi:hypothetical protein
MASYYRLTGQSHAIARSLCQVSSLRWFDHNNKIYESTLCADSRSSQFQISINLILNISKVMSFESLTLTQIF